MDMQDPTLKPQDELQETPLTEASAAATDAGISSAAVDTPEAPALVAEQAPVAEEVSDDNNDPDIEVELLTDDSDADDAPEQITDETLLAAAEALMAKDIAEVSTDEIRRLRQQYNMLHKSDEPRNDDEPEPQFILVIEGLRARKAELAAQQEAVRAANLERKNAIIAEITALAEDTDNVNRTFPRYRELQEEFNNLGDVDPSEETSVWKRFQEAREMYSDNLKINKELRDYDFKKNLAEKEAILEETRALTSAEDVIAAYRRLQELHNLWRQIGPVAKELREEIWNNFREASAEINKRYQALFEARKVREAENEAAKTVLCERIEAIDYSELRSFVAWEEVTKQVKALQEEWKTIGFASKKKNRELFARFRQFCDNFFAAKAEFFRNTREELAANLAKKQALVERAESLKDSTDWKASTDVFVEMQKEWKAIGAIPKRHSDALWNRFTAACDYFFDQKKKAGSGQRATEIANLKAKREIVSAIRTLAEGDEPKDAVTAELHRLQEAWKEIGHVPFRDKDKIYEAFRAAVDAVRTRFAISENRARRERFEANLAQMEGNEDKLFHERERLARIVENRRAELRTYENNLGFLSAKSKSGDTLVRDMSRRIERIKADIEELEEKISLLDAKL